MHKAFFSKVMEGKKVGLEKGLGEMGFPLEEVHFNLN